MKKLFSIKASSIAFFIFFSTIAHGAMVVKQIKGSAFMVFDSKTQSLHIGDHIPVGAEVLTEKNSELTLANYYNHQFHIVGLGHIKVDKKTTLLYEGYIWFRAISKGRGGAKNFNIQTANGFIHYNDTDGIVSFDPEKRKTQFLGLRGKGLFSNKNRPGPRLEITSGMFSFIHGSHKKGAPARATPVGLNSYKNLTVLFDGIHRLPLIPSIKNQMQTTRGRAIASIENNDQYNSKIMPNFLNSSPTTSASPAGPAPIQINFYRPSSAQQKSDKQIQGKPSEELPSSIKIGQNQKASSKKRIPRGRTPASLSHAPLQNPFEQALQSRYQKKMHHDKELNSLINALKSVNQDYQKSP